ncbi:MAG: IclR family transcriptional regulator [Dehalococcoidales bacterium]|nr:IclR family transcriptional regulator [Dehalococcoidales bacterium]
MKSKPSQGNKRKVRPLQAVTRSLEVLGVLASLPREWGVKELATQLDLPGGTVYRLLATLEAGGFVRQNGATKKYRLGLRLLELGNAVARGLSIRDVAKPFLSRLVEETRETSHLTIMDGSEVVYIDFAFSPEPIQLTVQIGGRRPAHCTAPGKAMLAYLPKKIFDKVVADGLIPYTPHTITDPEHLALELQVVREQGYAINLRQMRTEASGVAAPVFDHSGNVIAALGISGPSIRITDDVVPRMGIYVARAAAELSRELGFAGAQYSANQTPQFQRPSYLYSSTLNTKK